ncbi:DUF1667 domain-containing protein [Thermoanaerobacterium saccharolyticum]|uniref:Molybdopterin oxidoreductase n=2 Tax=Thermoanaerobacterium TaxID=28895 RepID=W9E7I6_9THEO|nr:MULTISPECIES: DUF1667 domain-containing protein [Thermoanaerobacterium]AFK86218.1 protein of unknown function DUF1667 [Thermoanaerobacterium saccharolyticum JW/SL-YS485]ETO37438.1 hypothetical protein V518_2506 [Thermoanaerobacterium aotearoense SCUT27]
MVKRELTCIVCPNGCRLVVEMEGKEIVNITGYECKRGLKYAEDEIIAPKRTLTTIVKAEMGHLPVVSVRTKEPIPKELIGKAVLELSKITLKPPINVGDIVVKNILDTGVDVIATRNLYSK